MLSLKLTSKIELENSMKSSWKNDKKWQFVIYILFLKKRKDLRAAWKTKIAPTARNGHTVHGRTPHFACSSRWKAKLGLLFWKCKWKIEYSMLPANDFFNASGHKEPKSKSPSVMTCHFPNLAKNLFSSNRPKNLHETHVILTYSPSTCFRKCHMVLSISRSSILKTPVMITSKTGVERLWQTHPKPSCWNPRWLRTGVSLYAPVKLLPNSFALNNSPYY